MIKKIFFSSLLSLISTFTTITASKVEFPLSSKKMAAVRKNNKLLRAFLNPDYIDLDTVNYNINVMWINKELKNDQEGIHPDNNAFVDTIIKWSQCNKRSVVNVWFDSEMTPKKSVENTQSLLNQRANCDMAPIVLQDIRTLPKVTDSSIIFSDSGFPVYFRADLARAIVLEHMIEKMPQEYSVYSDLDITPLAKDNLFDKKTIENLKKYGLVMADHAGNIENGFQIMSNHQSNLIKAHRTVVIDGNIALGYEVINYDECRGNRDRNDWIVAFSPIAQKVYSSYRPMFHYYSMLEGHGRFMKNHDNTNDYDHTTNGILVLGLENFTQKYTFESTSQEYMDKDNTRKFVFPQKNVNYPPLCHKYHLS